MKKLTLLLILMVLSINVWAEWTAVTKSSDNNITSYVDLQSIRKKGSKVKIWDLTDLKTAQAFNNVSYLSSVSHYEYDCSEETQQLLDFYAYSENMGLGETVNVQNNIKDEATTIKPGSIGETTFNVACSKKTKEKVVNNTQKYVWSLLYKADDINSYFDKSTIKRNGNVVTFDECYNITVSFNC